MTVSVGIDVSKAQLDIAVLDRYEKALNASDVDAVIELYAADGVFMPASAPTAVGSESVRAPMSVR